MTSTRQLPPRWTICLALGLTVIGIYYLLPTAGVGQAVVLTLMNVAAATCALTVSRKARGRARTIWLFLGIASALAVAANTPYYAAPLITGHALPFPSVVDGFWLLTYPCFLVALHVMTKVQRRESRLGNALDTTILVVCGTSLMSEFVLVPLVGAAGIPLLAHVVAATYPIMDILVFAMLVRVAVAVSWRSPAVRLLLVSFSALLLADTVYVVQLGDGTYHLGGASDGLWMVSYLFIGLAALHPQARHLAHVESSPGKRLSRGRLVFLVASVLTGPILAVTRPDEIILASLVSAVSFLLVVGRMTGLNRALISSTVELKSRACTDSLTGLANRDVFHKRLGKALSRPERRHGEPGILFIDLDDFKEINDTLGHAAGDELLRIVADRLRSVVRPADLVARLGGDEFGVLLDQVSSHAAAVMVANRAVEALIGPVEIDGHELRVGASVGVALRQNGSNVDSLMRQADLAMYTAKANGKNRVESYDVAVDHALSDHHALDCDIVGAAGRGEIVIDYQPVIDLDTGVAIGAEALIRWQHPTRGLLPPSAFIALAEGNGAIIDIGMWVLEAACAQMRAWQHRHARPDLYLAVNVSVRQLERPGFADQVKNVLARTGLDADRLVVEVTESVLADPAGGAATALAVLRAIGVRVALDDFGTGYSSMSYLSQLPVDILKIDRSFVSGASSASSQSEAILAAIIGLADRLGLDVIPEGIEETAQLARLQSLGCQAGQGYLLSRPLAPDAIDILLLLSSPSKVA
ncbi:MAG: diguanylate cyclase [Frankiaceae bacterium]|nr:diguanylate cyclase [Frankiaceae bacterium]